MRKLVFREPDTILLDPQKLKLYSITKVSDLEYWCYNHHSHPDFTEVVFVEAGSATYTLDTTEFTLNAGDFIIISPGVVHDERIATDADFKLWNFSFSEVSFYNQEPNKPIPDGIKPVFSSGELASYFTQRLQRMYDEQMNRQIHTNELCKIIACDILLNISRIIHSTPHDTVKVESDVLADQVKRYVDSHYKEQITLESLSKTFYVSTYYINHEMKSKLGVSPINYLIGRRIGEAQRLLLSTEMPITLISEAVGYENVHYFTNLFKKRVGCSPKYFRETFNKD